MKSFANRARSDARQAELQQRQQKLQKRQQELQKLLDDFHTQEKQEAAERAAAEQARLVEAAAKPPPWLEAIRLLTGRNSATETPKPPEEVKPEPLDLTKFDFSGLSLDGLDLSHTNLSGRNLREKNCARADFTGAELRNTELQNANLEDATLKDVKNLTPRQFGGANLKNIQPKDAVAIDSTAQVDEALKAAGKLYLTTVSLCIFSILVVLSTKDLDIILGTGQTKLPLVELQIPTGWFFVLTPLLITLSHLTLHLQLLRAWEAMTDLPAIYPDGRTIDRKVNPLLLNSIVLLQWPQLKGKLTSFLWMQAQLSKLTAYGAAPIAIFFFWGRYLVKQDIRMVIWHLLLLFVAWAGARVFRLLWRCTMFAQSQWRILFANWKVWPGHLLTIGLPLLLLGAYNLALYLPFYNPKTTALEPDGTVWSRLWFYRVPVIRNEFGSSLVFGKMLQYRVTAQLKEATLTPKPAHWIDPPEHYLSPNDPQPKPKDKAAFQLWQQWQTYRAQADKITHGAQLSTAHLRYANLESTFLVKADLIRADLIRAKLTEAKLAGANLAGANLAGTDLSVADLFGAKLNKADLSRADLSIADLREADLRGADLRGANLFIAYLTGADLRGADLLGADLGLANLNGAHYTSKGEYATRWPVGYKPSENGAIPWD